jgi:hypothetical protein
MWDAEKDDDASFQRRLDSVVREIGDRGKVQVSEAVPPAAAAAVAAASRAPAPAPAPAASPKAASPAAILAPAPTLAPTLSSIDPDGALAPTRDPSYTSSLPQHEMSRPPPATAAGRGSEALAGSLEAMAALLERQHDVIEARMEKQREQTKAERAEMEAKLESKLAEQKVLMETHIAMSCVSEGQLELLQTRLDALHQAKLLTDDELAALEDCVADYIDCCSSLNPAAVEIGVVAEKVKKMVGLSERVGKDGTLARQLRRKFVL